MLVSMPVPSVFSAFFFLKRMRSRTVIDSAVDTVAIQHRPMQKHFPDAGSLAASKKGKKRACDHLQCCSKTMLEVYIWP